MGPFAVYEPTSNNTMKITYPLITYKYGNTSSCKEDDDSCYQGTPLNTSLCVNNTDCLKDDFWEVVAILVRAEYGDKTFCLLITLSMMWSYWKSDDDEHNHGTDDSFLEKTVIIDENNIYKSHGHI